MKEKCCMKKIVSVIMASVLIFCGVSGYAFMLPDIPEDDLRIQLDIIADSFDLWSVKESSSEIWCYGVTDFDGNGRLEIVSGALEGTGLYTYAGFYEVNAEKTGLYRWRSMLEEGWSDADFFSNTADRYTNPSTGEAYYLFEDMMRNGMAEYYRDWRAVSFLNGEIREMSVANMAVTYDYDGNESVICKDINGNTITEEQYLTAADAVFSGYEKNTAVFDWISIENNAAVPSREGLLSSLRQSWDTFRGGEENIQSGPVLVFASDFYDRYGFAHRRCDRSGTYRFTPVNSDGVIWEVYILDAEFNDAERFIPQAYPLALEGEGTLQVNEGDWIYVYCPCNTWTTRTAPDGCAYSWELEE